jgi:serine/threonine-protein kinase
VCPAPAAGACQGPEEHLYTSNAPLTLTDWSMDGRFLSYFSTDLTGGALFALPLAEGERKPIEIARSPSQIQGPRLSPDSRFVAYISNESGRQEVYVRPFTPPGAVQAGKADGPWKVSADGGIGMAYWRRDGRELYYLAANRAIMAVPVNTSGDFEFGRAQQLFRPAEATPVSPGIAGMSRDGSRIVIAVPPPQLRQLTVFDRAGKIASTVAPARAVRAAGGLSRRHPRRGHAQPPRHRQHRHLGLRSVHGQGHAHHRRYPARQRPRLVAGRQVRGLGLDAP